MRAQLMEQAKQKATRSISIRVPIADLEQAQRIAEETGIGYQNHGLGIYTLLPGCGSSWS